MTKYMGIADAHGIESFLPVVGNEKQAGMLNMRAMLNRQRHAVFYVAELSTSSITKINNEIYKKRNFINALKILKKSKLGLWFPDQPRELAIKSWKMIPNPDLDPWR